ncbi:MAG: molybdopterin-dependent oxidoreductase [Treponema sp.]|nr:molybdopterin-dependent oxidoreductase [Treponema sp.]
MELLPFLEDIFPRNALYAKTIRSPVAKGFLKLIQTPKIPEGYTVITSKNIPGINNLEGTKMPILADSNLSYIGEPVGILLGPDKTKLEELAARIKVICDEETPVFTLENESVITREINIGDALRAMEISRKIVTGHYKTGIQDHWYAEPVGAVTWFKDEGSSKGKKTSTLIVRTATQWPYHVKRCITRALGIEPLAVSVEPTALNLHMDGKLWYPSLISCHAALGTFITKKPVRFILSREEDFHYTPKRCSTNIAIAASIGDNGKIDSAKLDISVNLGAFEVNGEEILDQICFGSIGLYNFNNLKLNARAYCTNIPPQGPFSGFGLAQGIFAIERHVSLIADTMNIDPAVWRKDNINTQLISSSAVSKNSVSGEELINTAASMSDYHRKWASFELLRNSQTSKKIDKSETLRGIGIAAGFQGNGVLYPGDEKTPFSVEVTLTKESILEIKTSITSTEDYSKIWQRVAAVTMSIEPEMVRIVCADAPDCGPSCASRNITVVTKLVEKCCIAIRKQRFHDPLPITVRRSVKPQAGSLWGGRIKVKDSSGFEKPGLAAAVVEVSIDLIDCIPVVRGVWLCVDGGKIISKNRAKRALSRAAAQSLGWAFTEIIEYINGVLPRAQYDNFTIFSPMQIPPIHIDFLDSKSADPKGIGDVAFTCIPAAFHQAVSQALDHSFKSIPLKRKEIWEMIRARNIDMPGVKNDN